MFLLDHVNERAMDRLTARWLLSGFVVAGAGWQGASEASAVARNILERHGESGLSNREIIIGTAELAPRALIGFHTHPGDESGFVAKGSIILRTRGRPDRKLIAGESFFNARGAVHSVVAGSNEAMIVSTWIVDQGVPLAMAAP